MKKTSKILGLIVAIAMIFSVIPMGFIAYAAAGDVEINAANFPDEIFRDYVSENLDTSEDGVLSSEEIAAVTEIDVGNEDIASLKGVEYFTEVVGLYCSWNELTELDVSKNTKLESLSCYENSLTSLNLSKNTLLTNLDCSYNQITSLDISKNTKLAQLDVGATLLTKLDVSQNTALCELYAYDEAITSLDISWVPNIRKAYLEGESWQGETSTDYEWYDDTYYYCLSVGTGCKVVTNTSKDFVAGNNKYTVTGYDTVTFNGVKKAGKTVKIPDTVKYIGKTFKVTEVKANALKKNKKVKTLTIGKNVSKIGKSAFYGCKNLKKITIKTTKLTKKNVGASAFKGINAKAKIKVPKSKLKSYKKLLKTKGIKKQKITK